MTQEKNLKEIAEIAAELKCDIPSATAEWHRRERAYRSIEFQPKESKHVGGINEQVGVD